MKKLKIIVLVIAIILIAAQNVTMFVITNAYSMFQGNAFWSSVVFLHVALLTTTAMMLLNLNEKSLASMSLKPFLIANYAYVVLELVLGNLLIYLPNMTFIPALASQGGLYVIYLAVMLLMLLGIIGKKKKVEQAS